MKSLENWEKFGISKHTPRHPPSSSTVAATVLQRSRPTGTEHEASLPVSLPSRHRQQQSRSAKSYAPCSIIAPASSRRGAQFCHQYNNASTATFVLFFFSSSTQHHHGMESFATGMMVDGRSLARSVAPHRSERSLGCTLRAGRAKACRLGFAADADDDARHSRSYGILISFCEGVFV